MMIFGAGINVLACVRKNYALIKTGCRDVAGECKRHDLAEEKLQKAKDKWNENKMKRLDFINKNMHQRDEAKRYTNSVNVEMVGYYQVFAKQTKTLRPDAQLSDFYHSSEFQINGELLVATVGTCLATYTF